MASPTLSQEILDTFDFLTIRDHACRQTIPQHSLGEDELFTDFAPRFQQWNGSQCSTCFEDYQAGDVVSEMQCGHYQHTHCFVEDNFRRNVLRCSECRANYLNPWLEHAVMTESRVWSRLLPTYCEQLNTEDNFICIVMAAHFATDTLLELVQDVADAELQRDGLLQGVANIMNLFNWFNSQSSEQQYRVAPALNEKIKQLVRRAIFGPAQTELKPGSHITSPEQCQQIIVNALSKEPSLAKQSHFWLGTMREAMWEAVKRRQQADEGYASDG